MKQFLITVSSLAAILWLSACNASVETGQVSPSSAEATPTLPILWEPTTVSLEVPPLDPNLVALGEIVYAQNCASCHGVNLEGQTGWKDQNEDGSFKAPPHNADGHTWHHADSLLLEAIELGGARFEGLNIGGMSNMPAFGEILTDEEVTAVLAFIKSTWPADMRAMQQQASNQ